MFSRCINKLKKWSAAVPSWAVIALMLFLITAVATFIRFYQLGKLSLWSDEVYTMLFVNNNLSQMLSVIWPTEMNMSLFYLLVNLWTHLFSNSSEGVLRIIPAIFSIASIPIVFFLGRTVSSDRKVANATGLVAALLISLNVGHVQYAQELRSYSLVFLLATLSTLLFVQAVKKPDSRGLWIGYILVSVVAVYSHYLILLLILTQGLSLLVLVFGGLWKFSLKKMIIGYLAMALLIVPLIVAVFLTGTGGLAWVTKPTFDTVLQFSFFVTGNYGFILLALYIIAAMVGLLFGRSWRREEVLENWTQMLFAGGLFLPAGIALLVSEIFTPIFVGRYFIYAMPFLAIFAALGMVKLFYAGKIVWKSIGALLFILIAAFSIFGLKDYFTKYQKEDWRGTSAFLTANCLGSGTLRLYYPTWSQNFTSFYDNRLKTNDAPAEKSLEDPTSDKVLSLISDSYKEVCLVRRWDEIKSLQNPIQRKYPNVTTTKFFGIYVDVYKQ